MQIIKGFVSINAYINNTPDTTSSLGELSTWSCTYSKERGEYTDTRYPGYKLITFRSTNDVGTKETTKPTLVSLALSVVSEAVLYNKDKIRPLDTMDFLQFIIDKFQDTIYHFNMGLMVDNGLAMLPEWISFITRDGQDEVKVWLSDKAFLDQYDEYEFQIIPPVTPVDSLFGPYPDISARLKALTFADISNSIVDTRKHNPDTYMRVLTFKLVNPLNRNQTTDAVWVVLVYGKAGDQLDYIKEAIISYVMDHTAHSKDEWTALMPEIFKKSEFVLLPRWDDIAIPNLSEYAALYGSIQNPVECINFAKRFTPFYTPAHTDNNISIFPFDYKGIVIVAVNGIDNLDDVRFLMDLYEDYVPVHTQTLDFNRISVKTQQWMMLVEEMLIACEVATAYSTVPGRLRRVVRNGVVFLSAVLNNVNYLMATRDTIVSSQLPGLATTVATPFIRLPAEGAIDLGPVLMFNCSEFLVSNNNKDVHIESEWQLSMDPTFATVVASYTGSDNLNIWTKTVSVPDSTYYVRVRQKGQTYGWSGWSSPISFKVRKSFVDGEGGEIEQQIPFGTLMDGGYYAGVIQDSGSIYRILVAPRNGGESETTLMFRDPILGEDTAYDSRSAYMDGRTGTNAMIEVNDNNYLLEDKYIYPVAQFIQGMRVANFNGHNDWYIPARDELEIIYRNLKATTNPNNLTVRPDQSPNGMNAHAYRNTAGYTLLSPGQTLADLFKDTGAEALEKVYWTTTALSEQRQWIQSGFDGRQDASTKHDEKHSVRAIRRVKISS